MILQNNRACSLRLLHLFSMKSIPRNQILVVEDDRDDIFLLTNQLARAEINEHVLFIDNGKEALDFLLKAPTPPIALFLDLHLPGLSGVDLLERMRREPRLQDVPVVVMTGYNDPHDMKRCHELGITAYLQKPVNLSTFLKTVADLFQSQGS